MNLGWGTHGKGRRGKKQQEIVSYFDQIMKSDEQTN